MKPIILVTASLTEDEKFLKVNRAYTSAVERSGGVAVVCDYEKLENIKFLLGFSNGVLLTGGGDVEPSFFGEAPIREVGESSPKRDAFELALTRAAIERNLPVLGICRGMQVINIACGGKIYQDIYAQNPDKNIIKHSQEMPGSYGSHMINVDKDTRLHGILGDSAFVNSFHHQAVSVLGNGIVKSAVAHDNIVEAIELKNVSFCVGVQWHPERITKNNSQLEIFNAFIRSAKNIL